MRDEQEQRPDHKRSTKSEFDFIDALRQRTAAAGHSLVAGIGDDAAVLRSTPGKETVLTADLLVEDIDFRRTTTPPYLLGHKALAVSLSDIAAMGARPLWSMVSIGVPEDVWGTDFVERLYDGLLDLASRYGVQLIGGDTSRTNERIVIDSIVSGECAAKMAVMRSGAQVGDQVFVTGSLGAAAAGLRLIERGAHLAEQNLADDDSQKLDHILLRQLRPEPRVGWGIVIGEERLATSMIDLSDGLSSDLNRLCAASNVGALIDSALLPVDDRVTELCGRRALDPLQLALHGGEDFELLFTVNPDNVARLPRRVDGVEIKRIGEITDSRDGVRISEGARVWELKPGGWVHF
ncbi:MAG TPA: thiamine-phosphate kinase [Pyrinomonadaceae bacterium]|jgi:thiamine-monophosphate kinase|nr:thiamine-phosphate kinase [Pyrinomonadaceae bacterium]